VRSSLIALHLIGMAIWVGGMFIMHHAVRPTVLALLEGPARISMMHALLTKFFRFVWVAIGMTFVSGWVMLAMSEFKGPRNWHIMALTGTLMVLVFLFIYFGPKKKLDAAVAASAWPDAVKALDRIRGLVLVNLGLGIVTIIVASLRW
jgi:uncharacterized membrane protein